MDASRLDIDLDAVRGFLRLKENARAELLDRRFAQATEDFRRIVERILERHKPERIYQWGSLLDRSKFSEISDIDIAVEGLDGPASFFSLLDDVEGMSDFPLDIVEMERIGAENAAYIRDTGRLVHERTARG